MITILYNISMLNAVYTVGVKLCQVSPLYLLCSCINYSDYDECRKHSEHANNPRVTGRISHTYRHNRSHNRQ